MTSIWVTVAVTDRAAALGALMRDLEAQTHEAGVRLVVLVVENSASPEKRAANWRTVDWLRSRGADVTLLDGGPYRRPICQSRERQRRWVADQLTRRPRPAFVWMLDDDNRLDHLVEADGVLGVRRLEHHVQRLLDLAKDPGRPDLLIGRVCGDPPIPPAATLASRLTDLEVNLEALLALPSAPAVTTLAHLPLAHDFDAYYDFSHEREDPSWSSPRRWLAADPEATGREELERLLSEASCLGQGVALTRPLVAVSERLEDLASGYRRGGNAVFFEPMACLDHEYPAVELYGLTSRRGDMIGSALLSRHYRVRTSGFTVRHARPRTPVFPTKEALVSSIASDTWGAALARGVVGDGPQSIREFLLHRSDRIEQAMEVAVTKARRIRPLVERAVGQGPRTVLDVIDWVVSEAPVGSEGTELLAAPAVIEALTRKADELESRWRRVA